MRLFISIDPAEYIIEEAKRIQNILCSQEFFKGTLVKQEQMHSTLVFLGEIEESQVKQIIEKLDNIKIERFSVNLTNLSVNSWHNPHVIWLDIESPALENLAATISKQLGIKQDRQFRPHFTIARIKKILDKSKLKDLIATTKIHQLTWPVDQFFLQKSELCQQGAQHSVIKKYKLQN